MGGFTSKESDLSTAHADPSFCSRALFFRALNNSQKLGLGFGMFFAVLVFTALVSACHRKPNMNESTSDLDMAQLPRPISAIVTTTRRLPARKARRTRQICHQALAALLGTAFFGATIASFLLFALVIQSTLYCPAFDLQTARLEIWIPLVLESGAVALAFDAWLNLLLNAVTGFPRAGKAYHWTPGRTVLLVALSPLFAVMAFVGGRQVWETYQENVAGWWARLKDAAVRRRVPLTRPAATRFVID